MAFFWYQADAKIDGNSVPKVKVLKPGLGGGVGVGRRKRGRTNVEQVYQVLLRVLSRKLQFEWQTGGAFEKCFLLHFARATGKGEDPAFLGGNAGQVGPVIDDSGQAGMLVLFVQENEAKFKFHLQVVHQLVMATLQYLTGWQVNQLWGQGFLRPL